ncbi:MAG: hypothetical protein COU08_01595 [Candidatus Harrisonbacteria bacterium CG10_big_fil_rev_8_21_14_0_10_42_17]|uniref:DUF2178 domain-containing protein n=1 Tax=Candidatus Harrisonbacteria bacterium CG10_big_fil_rev_8_21_14_0_10_42_17 TaxID=1974584 RepID=A0A2M6WIP4_9BACT|nr:MAG: hypothetical protein COU08_01595 [Candidatus Harrisonbacteria bacterium CG10_big_fil_rev_8_21_14_0_10_42_17]
MNHKTATSELFISIILIALLVFFLNPFEFWMKDSILMMISVALIIFFGMFSAFVWRENIRDEREGLHRMLAGRFAFLVGATMLVIGIIIQSFNNNLDTWLVATLGGMIFAKIAGLIYGHIKH